MLHAAHKHFLRISTFIVLALIAGLISVRLAHAQDGFHYNVAVNYDIDVTGVAHVTERYTVVNDSANRYLQSIQISTPTDDISNIQANYTDGVPLNTSASRKSTTVHGYTYDYQQVNVDFSRHNVGYGSSWSFELSYDTSKLVESKGGGHTVYIPAISANDTDNFVVRVLVPNSFGGLQSSEIKPEVVPTDGNKTLYTFPRGRLDQSVTMVFGDKTIYQVNFGFPLNNDTALTRTFTVTLPPNTASQTVFLKSLDPQPSSTSLDADGNILADYIVPPRTNIQVKTDVLAEVKFVHYDLSKSGTKADIPHDLVWAYTGSTQYWQSDNVVIKQKARELTAGKKTVADQVKAINDYVIDTLNYNNEKIKYNIRQGGVKALQNPSNAVCLEYSDLSISLLRAAGIPARMPVGYGYSGNLKPSSSVSDSLHSWVQAYIPNVGWVNVDPTWGEKFNNFGTSDLDHLTFAIWGARDSSPAPVMAGGTDLNYQYENATLSYLEKLPQIPPNANLSVSQFVVLPFVSLAWANITAPQSQASSSTNLLSGGKIVKKIAPLAPGEKTFAAFLVLGMPFANSQNYTMATNLGNDSITLARTISTTQWWPLIVVVVSVVAAAFVIKSRATNKRRLESLQSELDEVEKMEIKEHINDRPSRKKK